MSESTLRWAVKSEFTQHLQQNLMSLGYDLPKYGADGWMGHETEVALDEFAEDHGAEEQEYWIPSEDSDQRDLDGNFAAGVCSIAAKVEKVMASYHIADERKHSLARNVHGRRTWPEITQIVLHQTGVWMSDSPLRFRRLRAHIGVLRDGVARPDNSEPPRIVLVHELLAYLWHANSLNRQSVGIEINGRYAGLIGRSSGKTEPEPPERQIRTARTSIRFVCDLVGAHGGIVRNIAPHRISNLNRRGDPGEAIWKNVGKWAQDKLGLSDGGPFTVAGGRPIPHEWDGRYTAEF